ncbi:YbaB/EbfC family nucleoid-associated protein [Amycolatopsis nigrescens]|uniref:YbaB/EbfC family nucleoid-associated protein n=1 Tax=Amycolatopsis nigrescens TaxID=381445 RepID=UPI000376A72E|nr:YbaB/EbfC family nucleoid-associated protein [Amycolatopsis nigrescens]
MSAEFDRLVAEFEKFQSKIHRLDDSLGDAGKMQTELSGLEATATSADRSVTVVAGSGGAITDIRVTEDALKQGASALSATLMSTLQQAIAESARRQAAIVEEHMGGGMGLSEKVLETQAELFGTSVDDLRSKVAEAKPPKAPVQDDEDYYAQQSMLKPTGDQGRPAPPPPSGGASAGDQFLKGLFDEEDR